VRDARSARLLRRLQPARWSARIPLGWVTACTVRNAPLFSVGALHTPAEISSSSRADPGGPVDRLFVTRTAPYSGSRLYAAAAGGPPPDRCFVHPPTTWTKAEVPAPRRASTIMVSGRIAALGTHRFRDAQAAEFALGSMDEVCVSAGARRHDHKTREREGS